MVKLSEAEKKQAVAEASKEKKVKGKEDKIVAKKEEAKKSVPVEKVLTKTATLQDLKVVLHPLVTEKAVNMIEAENKITFIVNDDSTKDEVKKVIQEAYGVKVDKVNIIRDMRGRKKAIVKLDKKFKAGELATKLGVL
ncbi:MAG: 50S ribosomal protein L23 [Candidatus Iainarchaeum sp.]|jgi:ribosomal protein uL23|nr:MAG: 50S ribosomal protein L23P [archaeon ADurb.Bin336]